MMLLCSVFFAEAQQYDVTLSGSFRNDTNPDWFYSSEVIGRLDGVEFARFGESGNAPISFNRTFTVSEFDEMHISVSGSQRIDIDEPPGTIILPCSSNPYIGNVEDLITTVPNYGGCATNISRIVVKPKITIQSDGTAVCAGSQLVLSTTDNKLFPDEAYNWQYLVSGGIWTDFPSEVITLGIPHRVEASIEEIVGANHEEYYGQSILFRAGGYGKGSFSNSLSIAYSPCAPLVEEIAYTPPRCFGDESEVVVKFERFLDTGELFSQIEIIDTEDPSKIFEQIFDIGMDVVGGNTFTFNEITGLEDGKLYAIRYQMKVNTDIVDGFITSSQTFTYKSATQVAFSLSNKNIDCFGESTGVIEITANGGTEDYEYKLDDGLWIPFTSGNIHEITDLAIGRYTIQVRDTNECVALPQETTITQEDQIEITGIEIDATENGVANGAIKITEIKGGTAPYTFLWSNGEVTKDISGVLADEYILTVTDTKECSVEKTFTINEPDLLIVNIAVAQEILCNEDTGTLDVTFGGGTPPYTFQWLEEINGVFQEIVGATNNELTNLGEGTYAVRVMDSKGVYKESTNVNLIEPLLLEVSYTKVNPICLGDSTGAIDLTVSGGTPPYTYSWSNGASSEDLSSLIADVYNVEVFDANGCSPPILFVEIDTPEATIDLGREKIICKGQSYVADATSEDPNAIYLWTSDNGFESVDPIVELSQEGNYKVEVISSEGCMSEGVLSIEVLDQEIVSEFIVSSDIFVKEPFVLVGISQPIPDSVEWILPEEAIAIDVTNDYAEIQFDEVGEYEVTMITQIGECQAIYNRKITVRERSFSENDEEINLKKYIVYPNPNNGNFRLDIELNKEAPVGVKVFSLANNTLVTKNTHEGESIYTIPYSLTLSPGLYFILLETQGKSYVRKIVVE